MCVRAGLRVYESIHRCVETELNASAALVLGFLVLGSALRNAYARISVGKRVYCDGMFAHTIRANGVPRVSYVHPLRLSLPASSPVCRRRSRAPYTRRYWIYT